MNSSRNNRLRNTSWEKSAHIEHELNACFLARAEFMIHAAWTNNFYYYTSWQLSRRIFVKCKWFHSFFSFFFLSLYFCCFAQHVCAYTTLNVWWSRKKKELNRHWSNFSPLSFFRLDDSIHLLCSQTWFWIACKIFILIWWNRFETERNQETREPSVHWTSFHAIQSRFDLISNHWAV